MGEDVVTAAHRWTTTAGCASRPGMPHSATPTAAAFAATLAAVLAFGAAGPAAAAGQTVSPTELATLAVAEPFPAAVVVQPAGGVDLRIQTDEVEAVLAILDLRARGEAVPETAWERLFASEGYTRMMARERYIDERMGLQRGYTDEGHRRFFATDSALLANRTALRGALDVWKRVDVERAGRRALAYLPEGTRLRGTVYPLLRAATNSFIFELGSENPAIFMYVDPGQTPESLEDILAHELHHVGSAAGCPAPPETDDERFMALYSWTGGFSEGVAVLAAAGSPDADPQRGSDPELRRAWEIRQDSVATDMAALGDFFMAIHNGTLLGDAMNRAGFGFINREGFPQGAFYTLGWFMASTVERELGRAAVVATVCHPATLMGQYNRAAATINARRGETDRYEADRTAAGGGQTRAAWAPLPVWPGYVLDAVGGG